MNNEETNKLFKITKSSELCQKCQKPLDQFPNGRKLPCQCSFVSMAERRRWIHVKASTKE